MTQLENARSGRITPEARRIARDENISPENIRKRIAQGSIVLPKNRMRRLLKPCGVGKGLRTKVNANIGTSKNSSDIAYEIKKMRAAIEAGADAMMDLSTGAKVPKTRRAIIKKCPVPLGTVPIYETVINGFKRYGAIKEIRDDDFFVALEDQAKDGVDFFTIHAGVTLKAIEALRKHPRILDIVSRGGAFLAEWMIANHKENPFYNDFDRVIDIAKRYDITLSLGDGLRPGSIADATDKAQVTELKTLGELRKAAMNSGVQVMIEGPGHVPIDEVESNVILEKTICGGAPFYVLGPLVTDIAPGYDHITSAIGGAIAASAGADFLCYVTPAEHLRLPTIEDVKEGVIASRIAAHAADIAKGVNGAKERDIAMSVARGERDWKKQFSLAIDQTKPKLYRKASKPGSRDVCSMCGEYCSIKTSRRCFKKGK
ncbi:MAG: phosphomethylpyrimidine synthase ThiC [Candidatus Omnitrophica bacterium]|nr:phosphomethylpyrimidine synthase ThiC [Candidatus Omnitrophota bacterium]